MKPTLTEKIIEIREKFLTPPPNETALEAIERLSAFGKEIEKVTNTYDKYFISPQPKFKSIDAQNLNEKEKEVKAKYGFTIPKEVKDFYIKNGIAELCEHDSYYSFMYLLDGDYTFLPITKFEPLFGLYTYTKLISEQDWKRFEEDYSLLGFSGDADYNRRLYFFDKQGKGFGCFYFEEEAASDPDLFNEHFKEMQKSSELVCNKTFDQLLTDWVNYDIDFLIRKPFGNGYEDWINGRD